MFRARIAFEYCELRSGESQGGRREREPNLDRRQCHASVGGIRTTDPYLQRLLFMAPKVGRRGRTELLIVEKSLLLLAVLLIGTKRAFLQVRSTETDGVRIDTVFISFTIQETTFSLSGHYETSQGIKYLGGRRTPVDDSRYLLAAPAHR